MILADKIINERKKNGWSQEELAEKISVSRQSISKWEGAQAVPDLQKIIKLAEVFSVSTDYLLKDDMEPEDMQGQAPMITEEYAYRRVSMEEADEYMNMMGKNAPRVATAVSMCITSPALLIFLAGLSDSERFGISENAASGIGVIVLLLMVAVAVFMFIVSGSHMGKYDYLEKEDFETAYGVTGAVSEKKKAYEAIHTNLTALGVILCIVSVIPLLIMAFLEAPDFIITAMVSVLLIIVACGVNLLIRVGMVWGSFERLLQERKHSAEGKRKNLILDRVGTIYWCLVTAGYLGWSFLTMRWEITWIVWPVAGVLYAVVEAITKLIIKAED